MAYDKSKTKEIKETIIERITDGNSLLSVIDNDDTLPSLKTIFNWLNPECEYHDKEFLHNYTRAKEIMADREFDEIKAIADDQENDTYLDKDGNEQINHNVINRARLRFDARRWRLAKMLPKKYGDRKTVELETKPQQPLFPDVSENNGNK